MENSVHVARKLKQITELVKEIEALLEQKPKQRKKRQEFSVDPELGATLRSLGFARRRSNGKTLINVPDLTF